MPSSRTSDRKVEVSLTNWILGGSLVSVTSTDSETRRRRILGRRVIIAEVDNKLKTKESEGEARKEEKKDGDGKKKKTDEGKNKEGDGDGKDGEKKKCKSCGRDCADEGDKKGGEDKTKKDSGGSSTKSEAKNSGGSKEKSDSGGGSCWSGEQDAKVKEMKATDKTWKEIAAEVGHHQGDCKKRWKELEKAGEGKSGGDGATDGGRADNNTDGSGWGNSWENGTPADGGNLSFGDLFMDAPTNEFEKQGNNNGNADDNQKGNNTSYGGRGNHHQAGEEGWRYKSNTPSEPSHRPQGKLQANDVWSKDDCEVLEILEAQYREHKWLQIQAGFFNWAGRMISADLIENKFQEDGAL